MRYHRLGAYDRDLTDRVRRKSPYPSTQDPKYPMALQQQAKELLTSDGPLFGLVSREWLVDTVATDASALSAPPHHGLERALNLATWLDRSRPEVRMSWRDGGCRG